jgi:hypothetical protein
MFKILPLVRTPNWILRTQVVVCSKYDIESCKKPTEKGYLRRLGTLSTLISLILIQSRDSAVGIATGYGLDDRGVGVRVPVGSRIFSSPSRPDWLWGPLNLLSNGYRGSFPGGKAAGA